MIKIVILLLLALDCLGNTLIGGSFKKTLSATAWSVREHRYWWWTHYAIDIGAFVLTGQTHHTRKAYESEAASGNVWLNIFN